MTGTSDAEVLVVDDELAEVYSDILSTEYEVRSATGGEEALEAVHEDTDVVLLDRRMPDMSGDTVLSELRSRGLDCQVAMLTAVEPDQDIVDLPFDDYKLKPVSQDELVGLIETLIEKATYDSLSQRYFTLASKKAALEVAGNDENEEYEELLDQLDEVRGEMDDVLDTVGARAAFQELSDGHA
jgi:DNA-binding response OmpR family regulator